MDLRGRELKIEMQGQDVRLLHEELTQLGFVIPDNKRDEAFFGQGTIKAVRLFQEKHGLRLTGVVEEMAVLVNREVEQPLVKGIVRAFDRDLGGHFRGRLRDGNHHSTVRGVSMS